MFTDFRLNDVTAEERIMFKVTDMGTQNITFVFACADSKWAYINFEILYICMLYLMMQSISQTVWDGTVG
jgi:hypothetical protein